jgi:2-methylisocitrate lyase-like PEP mutase family enzyme
MLEAGSMVVAPYAYDAITARLLRHLGFNALYLPGSQTGIVLGTAEPLLTLTEMAMMGEKVVKGVRGELPVILDAGPGFGDPVHVTHTVEVLEDAGVTAIHIEDTIYPHVYPYRLGVAHSVPIVPIEVYQQRLEHAVKGRKSKDFLIIARNDAYRMEVGGTREDAVKRAHAAMEAGADVIMPQGCMGVEDLRYFRKEIKDIPLCSVPRPGTFEVPELQAAGWQLVLHAFSTLYASLRGIYKELKHVKETGYNPPIPPEETREIRRLALALIGEE